MRLALIGNAPIRVQHPLHDVGFHQVSAVHARAHGAHELQRGNRKCLAEGCRRKLRQVFRRAEGILAPPDAPALARQVYPRLGREARVRIVRQTQKAKGLAVIVKPLRTDAQPDVHKRGVAGVLRRLRQRLRAVPGGFPAAYRARASDDADVTAAVEGIVQAHRALFERHRERDYLEGRARFVGVGQRLVAPLLCLCRSEALRCFFLRLGPVYVFPVLLADREEIVKVVISERRHRKYLARVHVHGDRPRAVLDVVILHRLTQVLLHVILYRRVDRRHYIIAVLTGAVFLKLIEQQLRAVGVRRTHGLPRRT